MGQQANKNAVERFRAGDIRILITCRALDEGLDIPEVSVGIILSGTSVKRQRIQRMGRIIRRAERKGRASLYYLHTAETAEDVCFLPDAGESHIYELEFHSGGSGFLNPEYDEEADILLKHMAEEGAGERKLKEAIRCLELGRVRADWRLPLGELDRRIKEARYTGDKNYWICMKKLSEKIYKEP